MINHRRAKRIVELTDWFMTQPKFTSPAFIIHRAMDRWDVSRKTAESYAQEVMGRLTLARSSVSRRPLAKGRFSYWGIGKPEFRKASEIK